MKTDVPDILQAGDFLKYLGVSRRTVLRWRKHGMPSHLAKLVLLAATGDLGTIAPEWRGWQIHRGKLCSPDGGGMQFGPGEVLSIPFLHMRIAALQAKVREDRVAIHDTGAVAPRRYAG